MNKKTKLISIAIYVLLAASISSGASSEILKGNKNHRQNDQTYQENFSWWSKPLNLESPVNTTSSEYGARLSQDMLTMYFCSNRPGGYGEGDIWMATRDLICNPWNGPINLGPFINTEYHESFPWITPDGLTLYFTSIRPDGYGGEDIYISTRDSVDAPWNEPVNLGPTINTAYCECQSIFTGDIMYFCSDRPGGYGEGDIWMATRDWHGLWNDPVNVGPSINTEYGEWNPSISPDGLTLYFDSENRPGGYGGNDIWMATRDSVDAPWNGSLNLGPSINTEYGEYTPWVCCDWAILYFCSDRPGGCGGDDLWMSSINERELFLAGIYSTFYLHYDVVELYIWVTSKDHSGKIYNIEILQPAQYPAWSSIEVLEVPEGWEFEEISCGVRFHTETNPLVTCQRTKFVFRVEAKRISWSMKIYVLDLTRQNKGMIISTRWRFRYLM